MTHCKKSILTTETRRHGDAPGLPARFGAWVSPGQRVVSSFRSAFTLIELLVVIGIIVLMLGLGVAAFNQITGSRSIAMASNQVSAFLSLARSQAMQGNASAAGADGGVLFYRDPKTGRTAMTLVWRLPTDPLDPDPLDRYKSWTTGIAYVVGDRVVALTLDNQAYWTGAVWQPRILTKTYRCILATNAVRPPAAGPNLAGGAVAPGPLYNGVPNADGALFYNNNWEEVIGGNITPIEGFDPQFLPNGVAVQTVNDSRGDANCDRYLRTGVILFDRLGRLDYQPWLISQNSFWGQLLSVTGTLPLSSNPASSKAVYSQLGLVLYDEARFSADPARSDNDWIFSQNNPPATRRGLLTGMSDPALLSDENAEEIWLDQNTTLLLVNRANGSLIKGE